MEALQHKGWEALSIYADPGFESGYHGIEKVNPDFAFPDNIVLPPHFPTFKPVGSLAFQPLTFSTSAVLTGQLKSDTLFSIGKGKTINYCAANNDCFV